MPYKDPQKQKEFQKLWKAEHPEKVREYWQESEKRETTKETRKRYRKSEVGKQKAKARRKRFIESHGGWKEATKNWPSSQPGAQRNAYYKFTHGLTAEEFEAQIAAQNNLCPIGNHPFGERGKKGDSPCQDHCHVTGENRAILCRNHNVMLGLANDDPAILEIAISYLKHYGAESRKTQGSPDLEK